jgi:hypothetical protein
LSVAAAASPCYRNRGNNPAKSAISDAGPFRTFAKPPRTCQVGLQNCKLAVELEALDYMGLSGDFMNSRSQFVALEIMCRERAAVAKQEMEYWLAEAQEWKRTSESSDPFIAKIPVQLDWCSETDNQ